MYDWYLFVYYFKLLFDKRYALNCFESLKSGMTYTLNRDRHFNCMWLSLKSKTTLFETNNIALLYSVFISFSGNYYFSFYFLKTDD